MAAIKSPNCSVVSGLVVFSAWRRARGGIGLRGTPVTAERLGSAAQRNRELMAAILRLKVRGFIRSASTSRLSSSTQSWQVLQVCPTRTAAFTSRQKRLVVRVGFLSVLLQPRQARGREGGNDLLSHFKPMGFLAVAGCMLLATAMSAALTSKPSNA